MKYYGNITEALQLRLINNWLKVGQYIFKGFIDEFRISKGVARWTENFSKPKGIYMKNTFEKFCEKIRYKIGIDKWKHVAIVNNNDKISVFLDGVGTYLAIDPTDWNFPGGEFTIDGMIRYSVSIRKWSKAAQITLFGGLYEV